MRPFMVTVTYRDKDKGQELFGPYNGPDEARIAARAIMDFSRSNGNTVVSVTTCAANKAKRRINETGLRRFIQ